MLFSLFFFKITGEIRMMVDITIESKRKKAIEYLLDTYIHYGFLEIGVKNE